MKGYENREVKEAIQLATEIFEMDIPHRYTPEELISRLCVTLTGYENNTIRIDKDTKTVFYNRPDSNVTVKYTLTQKGYDTLFPQEKILREQCEGQMSLLDYQ